MLADIIAGLVIGGIYSIATAGLVATYTSSGILNFAFGAIAYFVARSYYYFNSQLHWGILPSAILCILVIAPALGAVLYGALFRFLQQSTTVIKVVATIGLSVALPPIAVLLYGNLDIPSAPGLAPEPVHVFHVFGVAITADSVIAIVAALLIFGVGTVVLKYTRAGLLVRAVVESPSMVSISGGNPRTTALGVWMCTTLLAGLTGILIAPIVGLTTTGYNLLISAAFTAVLVGKFRRMGWAVLVAFLLGMVSAILQGNLPSQGLLSADLVASVPFLVMFAYLLYQAIANRMTEEGSSRGILDQALSTSSTHSPKTSQQRLGADGPDSSTRSGRLGLSTRRTRAALVLVAIIAILPLLFGTFWVETIAIGLCFAIAFLSFTLVIGEGGMIWLCMVPIAGVGAVVTAQLVLHGWPVLLALVVVGLMVVPAGILIGLLTTRLGGLYVSLVTLTFGILIYNLILSLPLFSNYGSGYTLPKPSFISGTDAFYYFILIVFCLVALGIEHLRRATTGMALAALRSSDSGARAIGIGRTSMRVLVAGAAAFVAALGGGLVAMGIGTAIPSSYETLGGLVWLAVLVSVGVRSNMAAAVAGISYTVIPALFANYLPGSYSQIPPILFGFGAIMLARNPDGAVAMQARQITWLVNAAVRRLRHTGRPGAEVAPAATGDGAVPSPAAPAPVPAPATATMAATVTLPDHTGDGHVPASDGSALSAEGVSVRFGGVAALVDVSIDLPRGTTVGLVGPNGAGKSTLFGVLTGFIRSGGGRVRLSGTDVTELAAHRRAREGIGRTFQKPELFSALSVRDHLVLAYRVATQRERLWGDLVTGRGWRRSDSSETAWVRSLLTTMGLEAVADLPVDVLPTGTSRLVEIARALAGKPRVLLLDEPAAGLDSSETDELTRALRRAATEHNLTILLVEHDLHLVMGISDLVYVLDFGQIIAHGPPQEVQSDPAVRSAFLGEKFAVTAVES